MLAGVMMMPSTYVRPRAVLLRSLVACLFLLAASPGLLAQSGGSVTPAALVQKLKGGGYNVYVRHAATDWSQSDAISDVGDTMSCDGGKVRQLSDKGREAARRTGKALKSLGIGFGKVFSSPYCRCVETARLMSGKEPEVTHDLMNLRSADFVGGREAVTERTRRRLSTPPGKGRNVLYAAHGNLGKAATGEYLGEGELLIVAPRGGGEFAIEGRLKLADLEKQVPD